MPPSPHRSEVPLNSLLGSVDLQALLVVALQYQGLASRILAVPDRRLARVLVSETLAGGRSRHYETIVCARGRWAKSKQEVAYCHHPVRSKGIEGAAGRSRLTNWSEQLF